MRDKNAIRAALFKSEIQIENEGKADLAKVESKETFDLSSLDYSLTPDEDHEYHTPAKGNVPSDSGTMDMISEVPAPHNLKSC